ncbi:MAG: beta-glucosidase [Ktedonobacterales bacterium]|nr:beta-glucosidase [Ktedonobacterales bacterium]
MADGRQAAVAGASDFPSGFLWGAATAAYQIEGAAATDGKGESIWDRYSHTPGRIEDGTTGDVACDSYARWREDVDLLAQLNLTAYRFSIAWPRVLATGRGQVNASGLDYYDRLVDGLLERGITPFVTLYHWDLPQALEDRGGWQSRDTAGAFADYARAVGRRLGDRVRHWITLNEPHIIAYEGYLYGTKAPGLSHAALVAPVTHALLLAHGLAVQALRAEARAAARIGLAVNVTAIESASDREEDVEAARTLDGLWHRWYLDPLYRGTYPADVRALLAMPDDLIRAGDLELIATPTDFLGVNYYTRVRVRAGHGRGPEPEVLPAEGQLTTMGWEVYPEGLTAVARRLHQDYAPGTLYMTESGAAYADTLAEDGAVHDPDRVRYLRRHLAAARDAIAAGVPLAGYFVWSLMDNFEWQRGYTQRFGLAYTDYATQRRILKDSGHYLAEVASANGARLVMED